MTGERYVKADQLAKLMGVSLRTVRQWAHDGMPSETWGIRSRVFLPSECIRGAKARGVDGREKMSAGHHDEERAA